MNNKILNKNRAGKRVKRHARIRQKIWGTAERPRLVVFRSLRNLEGQIVNDDVGHTLIGLSTLSPALDNFETEKQNVKLEKARAAGLLLAQQATEQGVKEVVFDRGGYKYHGRVMAFAEGAREGGLKF
ncbi:MAG: 50S ribosomal protein L18 [Gemmatimonadetes bacterium]|jgi:large subunit ribosomal protein L18|nr:50S ribosomal protein L18 [Gemmatimonadota bacterium]|tara:strand:+ start:2043 stop:2426 length:384 start_codon:yes stop_codon:yes gene_type:complete